MIFWKRRTMATNPEPAHNARRRAVQLLHHLGRRDIALQDGVHPVLDHVHLLKDGLLSDMKSGQVCLQVLRNAPWHAANLCACGTGVVQELVHSFVFSHETDQDWRQVSLIGVRNDDCQCHVMHAQRRMLEIDRHRPPNPAGHARKRRRSSAHGPRRSCTAAP